MNDVDLRCPSLDERTEAAREGESVSQSPGEREREKVPRLKREGREEKDEKLPEIQVR
jgi:hypothetical protein